MANQLACLGRVHTDTGEIMEVVGFSLDQSVNQVDDMQLTDKSMTTASDVVSVTGSIDTLLDRDDATGQGVLLVGAVVQVIIQPEGNDVAGLEAYSFTALVDSVGVANARGSMVTRKYAITSVGTINVLVGDGLGGSIGTFSRVITDPMPPPPPAASFGCLNTMVVQAGTLDLAVDTGVGVVGNGFVSPDGLAYFSVGDNTSPHFIRQYSFATAFDPGSSTFITQAGTGVPGSVLDLEFTPTLDRVFLMRSGGISQSDLGTAGDITTLGGETSVALGIGATTGMSLSQDGNVMFVCSTTTVYQFDLTTTNDITVVTQISSFATGLTEVRGVLLNGDSMYLAVGPTFTTPSDIVQYHLLSDNTLSGAVLTGGTGLTFNIDPLVISGMSASPNLEHFVVTTGQGIAGDDRAQRYTTTMTATCP